MRAATVDAAMAEPSLEIHKPADGVLSHRLPAARSVGRIAVRYCSRSFTRFEGKGSSSGWPVLVSAAVNTSTAGHDGALREWSVATGTELSGGRPAVASQAPPTDRGAMLFRKCAACHDFDPNDHSKAGPTFWHLVGRRAGTVAGYPYSSALKTSGLIWNEATIDRLFVEGPQAVAPGSKMPLQKMPSAQDRAELIQYLKRQAGGGRIE